LVVTCPGADDSLAHARRAQLLLGSDVWSRIIRIENTARHSPYQERLHALVFELAGILWFYTEADGTQSFSLHRNRLAEEKADFGPLLRDIEPGFVRWTVVPASPLDAIESNPGADLRNGCFIESYALLRRLLACGVAVAQPRLLSYYARDVRRRQGHTVLAYVVAGQVVIVDPVNPETKRGFPAALASDPRKLARALLGLGVSDARVLPLELPNGAAGRDVLAAGDPVRATPLYN
jgi:hypothetical protein